MTHATKSAAAALVFGVFAVASDVSARDQTGDAPRSLGRVVRALATDGVRYTAFQRTLRGPLHVTDSRTARTRKVPYDRAEAETCRPRDIASGSVLIVCEDAGGRPRRPVVLNLATRKAVRVPGPAPEDYGNGEARYSELGRYWASGLLEGHRQSFSDAYLNWRTGEVRYGNEFPPGRRPDINTRNLELLPAAASAAGVVAYDAPLRLRRDGQRGLLLERGTKRVARLSKCHMECRYPALSGGVASWAEGRTVRLYRVRSQRTTRWRLASPLAALGETGDAPPISHTRADAYFLTVQGSLLRARTK